MIGKKSAGAKPQLSGRSRFKRRGIFQDFADDLAQRSQLRAVDEAMIDRRGDRKLLLRHTLAVFYDRPLAHRADQNVDRNASKRRRWHIALVQAEHADAGHDARAERKRLHAQRFDRQTQAARQEAGQL